MKIKVFAGSLILGALCIFFSACKDDEAPKAGIQFELAEDNVNESNGTLQSFHPSVSSSGAGVVKKVNLVLDRATSEIVIINYSISGTASRTNVTRTIGGQNYTHYNDYSINDSGTNTSVTSNKITIDKGAKEATIDLVIYEDAEFEFDKDVLNDQGASYLTVILTLESIASGSAVLGETKTYTLRILEDDIVVYADWAIDNGTPGVGNAGDVDIDILFWQEGEVVWGAASSDDFEAINVPGAFSPGTYGISYPYYSGSNDNVNFRVLMFGSAATLNGQAHPYHPTENHSLPFTGKYKLININEYDDETSENFRGAPKIVQTMVKNGINYSNISGITVQSEGSRMADPPINLILERSSLNKNNLFKIGKYPAGK